MGLSGFLYLAIVVGWAVYLVPYALRRYDEANRARSVDRFSSAMRVLGRKDPVVAETPRVAESVPAPDARRVAARRAARRRRRVLAVLLLAIVVVGVLAAMPSVLPAVQSSPASSLLSMLPVLPVWSVAVPVGLTAGWLVLCRFGVRRERAADEKPADPMRPESGVTVGGRVEGDDEPTVELDRAELATALAAPEAGPAAVPTGSSAGGSLWDPVPVTLPTYVSKPRAARTIRTIELGDPETWTSGRTEESAALVEEAEQTQQAEQEQAEAEAAAPRRAVGE